MGYSIQNSETGEVDYIGCDSTTVQSQTFDEETGEPLNGKIKVRFVKHKSFQIPKKYLRGHICDEFEKTMMGDYQQSYQPSCVKVSASTEKKREEQKLKEKQYDRDAYIKMDGVQNDIILAYNKPNYRVFFIPTLFFFNVYVAFALLLIEMFLHFWAHKKNALTMNKEIYYRSPLHMLTSQFCAICRSESETEFKIFDMLNKQMRQARRSLVLKDVTKAIS